MQNVPILLFEDEHLLVVNKPPGLNTHSPAPYKGEGLYEWLRDREPRWATISIVHRLDKETSGVIVFPKTDLARRSLTRQFEGREVRKFYIFEATKGGKSFTAKSKISRGGDKYVETATGDSAETIFTVLENGSIQAEPLTGRTHQIRVHAAANGFPIKGDILYGGTASYRLHLHAAKLTLRHPQSESEITFECQPDFAKPACSHLRSIIEANTNAYRLINGAADDYPKIYAEKLGDYALVQSELAFKELPIEAKGIYYKFHDRHIRQATPESTSPQLVSGIAAPPELPILENGVTYLLKLSEGYSYGLFLDQRDNRRRVLRNYVGSKFGALFEKPGTALNVFAYTCGFSLCAALAGFNTTSLDLSKKYLEWGKQNFSANNIDPNGHDFIYGDAFDWMARLHKKRRRFDLIFLDPPTFSQSKTGLFRATKDFQRLVGTGLSLLNPNGVLFCSSNAATLDPEKFVQTIHDAVHSTGRQITSSHYAPQPLDFPITREEPAYLKTLWLRVS